MRKLFGFVLAAMLVSTAGAGLALAADTVYGFKAKTIDGKMVSLAKYKGKTLLIVNVASKCGHTPQYEGLEKLYEEYKAKGFVILGFPCNQFKEQEPGTDKEIKAFCTSKYNVQFPLFSKIMVNGDHADPLYKFLKGKLKDESGQGEIGWNFTKFLINDKGVPVKRFATTVEPEGVDADVKALLKP